MDSLWLCLLRWKRFQIIHGTPPKCLVGCFSEYANAANIWRWRTVLFYEYNLCTSYDISSKMEQKIKLFPNKKYNKSRANCTFLQ